MFDPSALIGLLKTHGLSLLAPLSVIEGPIVTVLAGWLSSVIGAQIWQIALVVIVGDLLGDVIFYAAGRAGPHALQRLLPRSLQSGRASSRINEMTAHFDRRGGRTLLLGKVTHSLGALVLVAAGAARMNIWVFLGWNLIATVPKSLLLIWVGLWLGDMSAQVSVAQIEIWLSWAVWGGAAFGGGIVLVWMWKRREKWVI